MPSVDHEKPGELISAAYLTALRLGQAIPEPFQVGPFLIQPVDALLMQPLPPSAQVLVIDSDVVFVAEHLDRQDNDDPVPTIVRLALVSTFWLPPAQFPVVATIRRLRDLADPSILAAVFPSRTLDPPRAA